MASKNTFASWQLGLILVVITLGLLGGLLHLIQPPCREEEVDVDMRNGEVQIDLHRGGPIGAEYAKRNFNGIKWAFYVFLWIMCLYYFAFVSAAFKRASHC